MNILITGASGFLGNHLVQELLTNTNYNIIAYTTNPYRIRDLYKEYSERIRIIADFVEIEWSKVDVLVNLAFPRNADGIQMALGLSFISDLFYAASKGGVGSVINISSQSVYSQYRKEPATEDMELNLETPYAVGKYATELMCNTSFVVIPHSNIRMASLIGVGFDQRITNKLLRKAAQREKIRIISGNQRFSFMDVRDAAKGIAAMIRGNKNTWREIYNLGTQSSYYLEDITKDVCDITDNYVGGRLNYILDGIDESKNSSIDSSIFCYDFNWKPCYELRDTLEWIYEAILSENTDKGNKNE